MFPVQSFQATKQAHIKIGGSKGIKILKHFFFYSSSFFFDKHYCPVKKKWGWLEKKRCFKILMPLYGFDAHFKSKNKSA